MLYRQGDILLKPIKEIPENIKKKNLVLAEGEATGHMHQFVDSHLVSCFILNNQQFIEVYQTAELIHNEHDTLLVQKGQYEVIRQREVDLLNEIQKVSD